ncbi:S-locus glycoprotein domain-containing protein [Artemisia annua]|uniref:S-locus glycoprotein domain-containing protein n=1 Tax=Artemisia annua TaxID=35608 RepID=A0A2U1P169_ARTAN|nr:S-locus glycoprotein domain-containing protein [Artemisia annua]
MESIIPPRGNSGVFGIQNNGSLSLSDGNGTLYWWTEAFPADGNLTAMLADTGNFILATVENAGDDQNALWQSCENPTDTYLPNMRVYMNSSDSIPFVSWRSPTDPSRGNYSVAVDPRGGPQLVSSDQSGRRIWRSGQWDQQRFTGMPQMNSIFLSRFTLVPTDGGGMYFIFTNPSTSITRFMVLWNGTVAQLTWDEERSEWVAPFALPSTRCEQYNRCGSNGICNEGDSTNVCSCMQGFVRDSSNQCVRRTPLECGTNTSSNDGFLVRNGVKLPDFAGTFNENQVQCEDRCSRNCSCNAYAHVTGIGCLIWGGDLMDIEQFEEGGETLFIRLAISELGGNKASKTAVIAASVTGTIVLGVIIWLIWRYRQKIKKISIPWGQKETVSPLFPESNSLDISAGDTRPNDLTADGKQFEGTLYSLALLESATDGFANKNKLGQGGFGPVHKAWNLWKEGTPEELIDPSILESCNQKEALRCIHVGMLCVQFSAVHRPTMSSVVYMLESESTSLPLPTQVGDISLNSGEMDFIMEGREITVSSNDVTVTEVIGR